MILSLSCGLAPLVAWSVVSLILLTRTSRDPA